MPLISEIRIQNFKSIEDLRLPLGRLTVLIGENGCGKSNILEGIALAAAAERGELEDLYLSSHGIRVTDPQFMRSAFAEGTRTDVVSLEITRGAETFSDQIVNEEDTPYSMWRSTTAEQRGSLKERLLARLRRYLEFVIYSPENSALRTFEQEGHLLPLGIRGEGLFKYLKYLSELKSEAWRELKKNLLLVDWYEDLRIAPDLAPFERTLQIKDRYLAEDLAYLDQRSSNEGFLFLLFYFALFVGDQTPSFLAIDNVDASLNPKLCTELIRRIAALAKAHDKQVILTTHNPAVLDGLDLNDEEQRLLVVYRNSKGFTKVRRVQKPEPVASEMPLKLSEAFLNGFLGGLPQNF